MARELGITDIIKLASNENPLGVSPLAVAAMADNLERGHQYPEVINPALQAALGAANGVAPECVVTGNGADSILYAAALAFLRPGDEVLVPQITFDVYRTVALTKGATVVEVPMPDLELTAGAILGTDRRAYPHGVRLQPQQSDRRAVFAGGNAAPAGGAAGTGGSGA